MYLLRPHRASISDSMSDLKEFETQEQMLDYVVEDLSHWIHSGVFDVKIERYTDSYDDRTGWNTTNVVSWFYDGQHYVWGFCTERGYNSIIEEHREELTDIVFRGMKDGFSKPNTPLHTIAGKVANSVLNAGYRKF